MSSRLHQTKGQLYLDGESVPGRSPIEANLVQLVKQAVLAPRMIARPGSFELKPPFAVADDDLERVVAGTPDENLRRLVDRVIKYVESDAYGCVWALSVR